MRRRGSLGPLLHRFEHLNDRLNLFVVHLDGLGQPRELLDQFARRGHQAAKTHEGPHDLDIYPHGRGRPQHAGEHGDAVFGEDPGRLASAAVAKT